MKFAFLLLAVLLSIQSFAQKRENRPLPVLIDSSQWMDFTNDTIWKLDRLGIWRHELHSPERVRILKFEYMGEIFHILHREAKTGMVDGVLTDYDHWIYKGYWMVDYQSFIESLKSNTVRMPIIGSRQYVALGYGEDNILMIFDRYLVAHRRTAYMALPNSHHDALRITFADSECREYVEDYLGVVEYDHYHVIRGFLGNLLLKSEKITIF